MYLSPFSIEVNSGAVGYHVLGPYRQTSKGARSLSTSGSRLYTDLPTVIIRVSGRAEAGEGPVGVVTPGVAAGVASGVAATLVGIFALVQD